MYGYVPERIYKKIETYPEYIAIEAIISTTKSSATTFKAIIESDSNFENPDDLTARFNALVEKVCPEYLLEFKVNNGAYTKAELLELYKDETQDVETRLFILSNIVNDSYEDGTFETYMQSYIDLYVTVKESDRWQMSSYTHLKYMYASCYLFAKSIKADSGTYKEDIYNFVDAKRTYALKYASGDTVNNYIIEAVNDIINILLSKMSEKKVLKFILSIERFVNKLEYQYSDYSYAYAKFLDHKFMIDLYLRNYDSAIGGYFTVINYFGQALKTKQTLFRGLNYYDKCSEGLFVILLRKYIKLKQNILCLKNNKNADIQNLSLEDYTFSTSEFTDIEIKSSQYATILTMSKQDVDDWFYKAASILANINTTVGV